MLFATSAALCAFACVSDPEVERRGGRPVDPVIEVPNDGSGGRGAGAAGAPAEGGGPSEVVAFCDALTVVRRKCQRCHGDPLQNGAPVPFLNFEDFHRQYGTSEFEYWEAATGLVERDVMPYVVLNEPPTNLMPPVEPLTLEEKATLLTWLQQGALPEGGTDCP
jgi:hypothetical protein